VVDEGHATEGVMAWASSPLRYLGIVHVLGITRVRSCPKPRGRYSSGLNDCVDVVLGFT
jgi:hypothetical protein